MLGAAVKKCSEVLEKLERKEKCSQWHVFCVNMKYTEYGEKCKAIKAKGPCTCIVVQMDGCIAQVTQADKA